MTWHARIKAMATGAFRNALGIGIGCRAVQQPSVTTDELTYIPADTGWTEYLFSRSPSPASCMEHRQARPFASFSIQDVAVSARVAGTVIPWASSAVAKSAKCTLSTADDI
jgi:hypothetical protein